MNEQDGIANDRLVQLVMDPVVGQCIQQMLTMLTADVRSRFKEPLNGHR